MFGRHHVWQMYCQMTAYREGVWVIRWWMPSYQDCYRIRAVEGVFVVSVVV